MTNEKLNEMLDALQKEMDDANAQLSGLIESDEDLSTNPEIMTGIEYLLEKINKITGEMKSLLQVI